MTSVEMSELQDHLPRYLAAVKDGEEVIVTDAGRPVARLTGLPVPAPGEERWLDRLAAKGVLRRAQPGPRTGGPPPMKVPGKPVSEMIIEDRG
ncbi:MAG TPA: type II toxin-antitoxin system prevent-host-death family antitoxin [Phycisphaerae bacterium]|nr:type II toxin-antitoxin system prevent-host-death family antitoxin [Phycisphaerae bacterium]